MAKKVGMAIQVLEGKILGELPSVPTNGAAKREQGKEVNPDGQGVLRNETYVTKV